MGAGRRLSSQQLYEQQKIVGQRGVHPAPDIVCCELRTPENMGAVLRVADAAGSRRVYFIGEQKDGAFDKKIKKVSRHSSEYISCESLSVDEFEVALPLLAIELTDNSTSVFDTVLPDKCAFVIGNERHGVNDALLARCDGAIHIPMYGLNGSMNVSHALAIVLYEWRRQQNGQAIP